MWGRGKVRGIGFHHDSSDGYPAGSVHHLSRVLKGGNTGERDQTTKLEDTLCLRERSRKAVKDSLQVTCKGFVDRESIPEGGVSFPVACVDNDILSCFGSKDEVGSEKIPVPLMIALLGPTLWRGMKIIETGFPDGSDPMVSGKFA